MTEEISKSRAPIDRRERPNRSTDPGRRARASPVASPSSPPSTAHPQEGHEVVFGVKDVTVSYSGRWRSATSTCRSTRTW